MKIDNRKVVPIFADQILAKLSDGNKYSVKAMFQRGMLELPLDLVTIKCQDAFLTDMRAINNMFVSYYNDYIKDLYTSNLNLDFDSIEVFSMLQQISFTSYGRDTFSSISLLIDSIAVQKDMISKCTADYALITFAQNLQLTTEQRNELTNLLNEKFKATSIKGIDLILQRVEENLCILGKLQSF